MAEQLAEERVQRELARHSLEEAVARGVEEMGRQRDAWRLAQAQRFAGGGGNVGAKMDAVLAGHLGI